MILDKIVELEPRTVLDVGCGCGEFTSKLSPYCGGKTAIDLSEAAIERASRIEWNHNLDIGR